LVDLIVNNFLLELLGNWNRKIETHVIYYWKYSVN